MIALTENEIAKLAVLLSAWEMTDNPNEYVNSLMQKWELIIQEIEKGYPLTIYDYENDLYTRTRLKT